MLFASLMVAGYSNAYPDVAFHDHVRASARTVVRGVVGRCLSEAATLLSLPAVFTGEQIFSQRLTAGPLGARLAQNAPAEHTETPTLIAQGEADSLVLPPVQNAFAHRLCQAGQKLEYRAYPGLDHVPAQLDREAIQRRHSANRLLDHVSPVTASRVSVRTDRCPRGHSISLRLSSRRLPLGTDDGGPKSAPSRSRSPTRSASA